MAVPPDAKRVIAQLRKQVRKDPHGAFKVLVESSPLISFVDRTYVGDWWRRNAPAEMTGLVGPEISLTGSETWETLRDAMALQDPVASVRAAQLCAAIADDATAPALADALLSLVKAPGGNIGINATAALTALWRRFPAVVDERQGVMWKGGRLHARAAWRLFRDGVNRSAITRQLSHHRIAMMEASYTEHLRYQAGAFAYSWSRPSDQEVTLVWNDVMSIGEDPDIAISDPRVIATWASETAWSLLRGGATAKALENMARELPKTMLQTGSDGQSTWPSIPKVVEALLVPRTHLEELRVRVDKKLALAAGSPLSSVRLVSACEDLQIALLLAEQHEPPAVAQLEAIVREMSDRLRDANATDVTPAARPYVEEILGRMMSESMRRR